MSGKDKGKPEKHKVENTFQTIHSKKKSIFHCFYNKKGPHRHEIGAASKQNKLNPTLWIVSPRFTAQVRYSETQSFYNWMWVRSALTFVTLLASTLKPSNAISAFFTFPFCLYVSVMRGFIVPV